MEIIWAGVDRVVMAERGDQRHQVIKREALLRRGEKAEPWILPRDDLVVHPRDGVEAWQAGRVAVWLVER